MAAAAQNVPNVEPARAIFRKARRAFRDGTAEVPLAVLEIMKGEPTVDGDSLGQRLGINAIERNKEFNGNGMRKKYYQLARTGLIIG